LRADASMDRGTEALLLALFADNTTHLYSPVALIIPCTVSLSGTTEVPCLPCRQGDFAPAS
jgi:hypothetical protein